MWPSEEFHTQKEKVVCVCLHGVSRTEKSIEIMINQEKMRNRKFLLGIRFCLRCWKILKMNYIHGHAIVKTYLTTWIIHWRAVKWQMLLSAFDCHEVAKTETEVISHPGSSVDTDEFSTVVGGSHHLVTLISSQHNTGETVCLQVCIRAHMYAQICTGRSPRKTEKNKIKQKAWQRYLLVWRGKELRNEPERPQGLSISFHANLLSLDFSTIICSMPPSYSTSFSNSGPVT